MSILNYIEKIKRENEGPRITIQEPRNMAHGGRIGFKDNPLKNFDTKKERIIQGLEKKRVSTKVDLYADALSEFNAGIKEAFDSNDASKFPKKFAQFLKDKGLKEGTYGHLLKSGQIPKINTNISKLRVILANKIIDESNNQLKFIGLEKLLKNHGFTSEQYKSHLSSKGILNKLDGAGDKAKKAYDFLFSNFDQPVENFFNPRDKIAKLTGVDVGTISKTFDVQKHDPDGYRLYKNLGNATVKRRIINQGLSLADLDLDLERIKTKTEGVQTRKTKEDIGKKYASQDDLIDFRNIKNKKSQLNKYFMENPDAINNTEFGKEIKKQMDIRIAGKDMEWDGKKIKKGDIWFKTRPDKYYYDVAKSDKGIFHVFDINPIEGAERFTRVPDNLNLATRDFNSGFVKQLNAFFKKDGKLHGNAESLKKVTDILDDYNIRVKIDDVGRIGTHEQVAVKRAEGTYPRITKTLERFKLPDELKKISREIPEEFMKNRKLLIEKAKANAALKTAKKGGFLKQVQKICRLAKSGGGRIGFALGPNACPLIESDPERFLDEIVQVDKGVVGKFFKTPQAVKFAKGIARSGLGMANPLTWIGGEAWYVGLEGMNSHSKGVPWNEALDDAFIFYDYEKVDKNIMDTASKMNLDESSMALLKNTMNINRLDSDMGKVQSQLEMVESDPLSEIDVGSSHKRIDEIKGQLDNEIQSYMSNVGKLFNQDPSTLSQENLYKGFDILSNVFRKKVLTERQDAYKDIATRADPLAGNLGNWLNTNIFNLDVWKPKYALTTKLTPQQEKQKYLTEIGSEFIPGTKIPNPKYNPRELYLYNKHARNLTYDSPLVDEALALRTESQPVLGTGWYSNRSYASGGRAGYMGGGITGIRKPHAIPPERQGLRSIMINGKKS